MQRIELYNNGDNFLTRLTDLLTASTFFTGMTALTELSDTYFLQHSGLKTAGRMIQARAIAYGVVDQDGEQVYDSQGNPVVDLDEVSDQLAHKVYNIYVDSWKSVYKALSVDYDVLNQQGSSTDSHYDSTAGSTTKKSTDRTTTLSDSQMDTSYMGFNSDEYAPSSRVSSGSTTNTHGEQDGNRDDYEGNTKTNTTSTKTFTGGNVDERIRRRIRLRDTKMLDIMMRDIDKYLTSPMYTI